jgi:radical SAM domain protein
LKISKVKVRSVIGTSKISTFSHAINAYVGCPHACVYCYAKFMRRVSGHSEEWGEFVDIKEFDESGLDKFLLGHKGQSVFMSSVTDCYNPVESKAKNTRKILEKLAGSEVKLQILTKSKLVLRDISLFKTMPNLRVGVSVSTLDNDLARIIEPRASLPKDRLEALKILRENGKKLYFLFLLYFRKLRPFSK